MERSSGDVRNVGTKTTGMRDGMNTGQTDEVKHEVVNGWRRNDA